MKLALLLLALMCAAIFVEANEGVGQMITPDDIKELKQDYTDLYAPNDGENAPIREMAQKTKDLTMKYFKTVGIEIARHMCNSLDTIIVSFETNNINT